MKDEKFWLVLITAIENLGMMAAWTILAIFFEKWWIALFALLCFISLKTGTNDTEDKTDDS